VPSSVPSSSSATAASATGDLGFLKLKDDLKFAKYLKMIKVGLPVQAVAQKMLSEGAVTSLEKGLEILALDPESSSPSNPTSVTDPGDQGGKIKIMDHPTYSKYFKMLKVGLPREAVKAKMQQVFIPSHEYFFLINSILCLCRSGWFHVRMETDFITHCHVIILLSKHHHQQEGVNPDIIDRDPSALIPLKETKVCIHIYIYIYIYKCIYMYTFVFAYMNMMRIHLGGS
jgi:hypothetical protein